MISPRHWSAYLDRLSALERFDGRAGYEHRWRPARAFFAELEKWARPGIIVWAWPGVLPNVDLILQDRGDEAIAAALAAAGQAPIVMD